MRVHAIMEKGIGKSSIEDRVLIDNTILAGGEYDIKIETDKPFIIAVADGVGGNGAGDVAAHLALDGLVATNLSGDISEESIRARVAQINQKIVEQSRYESRYARMATTLSGVCFAESKAILFHVGNCRIFTWSEPYLNQLTQDHSWANEMRQIGLSEEDIEKSGRSSEINACLGNGDVSYARAIEIMDVSNEINNSSKIIITSDGVHDFVTTRGIENGLRSMDHEQTFMRECLNYSREQGSTDDLSLVYISL